MLLSWWLVVAASGHITSPYSRYYVSKMNRPGKRESPLSYAPLPGITNLLSIVLFLNCELMLQTRNIARGPKGGYKRRISAVRSPDKRTFAMHLLYYRHCESTHGNLGVRTQGPSPKVGKRMSAADAAITGFYFK